MPAASQNGFRIQSVPLQVAVTFSDAAVETVVVTTVPYFNESTDIDFVSEMALCYRTCLLHEKVEVFPPALQQKGTQFTGSQCLLPVKAFYKFPHGFIPDYCFRTSMYVSASLGSTGVFRLQDRCVRSGRLRIRLRKPSFR